MYNDDSYHYKLYSIRGEWYVIIYYNDDDENQYTQVIISCMLLWNV